jgi:DNA-binding NarL/FixJ family response regulator
VQAYQNGKHRQAVTAADLTTRQREVLHLLAKGCTTKEIATSLTISTKNVEYHKYRIMELLGIKTSVELVRYALQQGFATP